MPKGSIASRLFLMSAAWLVIALVATALLLTELYASALDRQLTDALEFNLDTLVAAALEHESVSSIEIAAADPRFERVASGWYWQITSPNGALINASNSLVGSILPAISTPFDDVGWRFGVARDDFDIAIQQFERKISLPSGEFHFTVSGNLDENRELTAAFRWQAIAVLVAVGAALAVMSALVARVALRPIEKLRNEMEDVRDGMQSNIKAQYPSELAPLAGEVNELLRANAQIVERARSQVGNLAHGLKTPLAVLRNEAAKSKTELAQSVLDQTNRMSITVASYLDRARMAARTAVVGKRADTALILQRLVRVMQKLNPEREISLEIKAPIWFRGEETDLEEIVGNLVDNACKWAESEIKIVLQNSDLNTNMLQICVLDDGAGLTPDQRKKVLKRGVRLDEKVQGSGLGLDIVKELVDVYGGELKLHEADLGGLKVVLDMPAAKSLPAAKSSPAAKSTS